MFRLIVFDLDGTLVDSRRDLAESANTVLREHGCPPHSEEAVGAMVGDGVATLMKRVFAAAGCELPPDAIERFLRAYSKRLLQWTRPYSGVPELLEALQSRAILSVLTNKPLGPTQDILRGLNLATFFEDRVIGGDGPFEKKPDPSGLVHLMEHAGASRDETLFIGDSIVDWQTARAAGAHICIARYGFGYRNFLTDNLSPRDCLIDHPGDLLPLL